MSFMELAITYWKKYFHFHKDSRWWLISKKSLKTCFSMVFPDNLVCYSDTRPLGVRHIGFSNSDTNVFQQLFNPVVSSCCVGFRAGNVNCASTSLVRLVKTNCIRENFPTQTRDIVSWPRAKFAQLQNELLSSVYKKDTHKKDKLSFRDVR